MRLADGRVVALPTDVQRGPTRIHSRVAGETSDLAHRCDRSHGLWNRWPDSTGVVVSIAVSTATGEET